MIITSLHQYLKNKVLKSHLDIKLSATVGRRIQTSRDNEDDGLGQVGDEEDGAVPGLHGQS